MLMLKIQRASLVFAFLITVGALPLTHAQAASSVVGSTVCVRADVVGASGSGLVYTSNGVNNISGANVDIICTLFRDNTTNTNGLQDLELSITVPSGLGAGDFTCDALSLDRYGMTKKIVPRANSVVGNTVLDWGSSVNLSVSKGSYSLRCTVPNGGWIRSLWYLEP
jgi:hypothetical protein